MRIFFSKVEVLLRMEGFPHFWGKKPKLSHKEGEYKKAARKLAKVILAAVFPQKSGNKKINLKKKEYTQ